MTTRRFADTASAARYPLAVEGPAAWASSPPGQRVVVPLPALRPGTLLVPSLSLPTTDGAAPPRHRWTLRSGRRSWPLPDVPADAPAADRTTAPPGGGDEVSRHIDCFRIHRDITDAVLELFVDAEEPPPRYLIAVSARPFTIAEPSPPAGEAGLVGAPPPRSQMAAPAELAPRICSPTCVSMVLELWRRPHDWLGLCDECRDPATGMYGVWPMALRAAARRGIAGAVETFTDWQAPLRVLAAGVPLITSIRFDAGELPGAPLTDTGGHLVVVHGAGPDGIAVCDPAAPAGEVLRTYPAAPFSRAWLRHRGAAYILPT
jgi:hypothetical protein